jgi:hypothetical protein
LAFAAQLSGKAFRDFLRGAKIGVSPTFLQETALNFIGLQPVFVNGTQGVKG